MRRATGSLSGLPSEYLLWAGGKVRDRDGNLRPSRLHRIANHDRRNLGHSEPDAMLIVVASPSLPRFLTEPCASPILIAPGDVPRRPSAPRCRRVRSCCGAVTEAEE